MSQNNLVDVDFLRYELSCKESYQQNYLSRTLHNSLNWEDSRGGSWYIASVGSTNIFLITKFCSNKINKWKTHINRLSFSSLFPLIYFQPIYMILGKIIVIRTFLRQKKITDNNETSCKKSLKDICLVIRFWK